MDLSDILEIKNTDSINFGWLRDQVLRLTDSPALSIQVPHPVKFKESLAILTEFDFTTLTCQFVIL
jgi:hypothetical protein